MVDVIVGMGDGCYSSTLCRLLPPRINPPLLREIFEISEYDILKEPPFKRKFSWIHCLIIKIFLGASPPDPNYVLTYTRWVWGAEPLRKKIANLGGILSFFHQKNND